MDAEEFEISKLMTAWKDKHLQENPTHQVWLHRRTRDLALACFTCTRGVTGQGAYE